MANSIFLGPNVPQTINGTLTVNGSVTLPGATDFIAFGAAPALSGTIRLSNAQSIISRNAANSANALITSLSATNILNIGDANNSTILATSAGPIYLVSGAVTVALSGGGGAFIPNTDAGASLGGSTNRWVALHLSSFTAIGTTPSTAGTIRVQHNASCSGRNSANSGNLRVWDFGVVANNEARFGDGAVNNRICSLLGTPTTLSDGDWWVECTGTTPARTAILKVRDTGGTRTIATSVAY